MRGGHLVSKMRFVSAQLEAYLADGLWLKLARHANAMAQRLVQGLNAVFPRLPGSRLLHPVEANELFVQLPPAIIAGLRQAGFDFYDWPGEEGTAIRLVTAFNTDVAHVEQFVKTLSELASHPA
jgi:threonine aldolase